MKKNASASSSNVANQTSKKYSSVNVSLSRAPAQGRVPHQQGYGRMLVIGKGRGKSAGGRGGARLVAPAPFQLPSRRSENHGLDPNTTLVPSGGGGWGLRDEQKEQKGTLQFTDSKEPEKTWNTHRVGSSPLSTSPPSAAVNSSPPRPNGSGLSGFSSSLDWADEALDDEMDYSKRPVFSVEKNERRVPPSGELDVFDDNLQNGGEFVTTPQPHYPEKPSVDGDVDEEKSSSQPIDQREFMKQRAEERARERREEEERRMEAQLRAARAKKEELERRIAERDRQRREKEVEQQTALPAGGGDRTSSDISDHDKRSLNGNPADAAAIIYDPNQRNRPMKRELFDPEKGTKVTVPEKSRSRRLQVEDKKPISPGRKLDVLQSNIPQIRTILKKKIVVDGSDEKKPVGRGGGSFAKTKASTVPGQKGQDESFGKRVSEQNDGKSAREGKRASKVYVPKSSADEYRWTSRGESETGIEHDSDEFTEIKRRKGKKDKERQKQKGLREKNHANLLEKQEIKKKGPREREKKDSKKEREQDTTKAEKNILVSPVEDHGHSLPRLTSPVWSIPEAPRVSLEQIQQEEEEGLVETDHPVGRNDEPRKKFDSMKTEADKVLSNGKRTGRSERGRGIPDSDLSKNAWTASSKHRTFGPLSPLLSSSTWSPHIVPDGASVGSYKPEVMDAVMERSLQQGLVLGPSYTVPTTWQQPGNNDSVYPLQFLYPLNASPMDKAWLGEPTGMSMPIGREPGGPERALPMKHSDMKETDNGRPLPLGVVGPNSNGDTKDAQQFYSSQMVNIRMLVPPMQRTALHQFPSNPFPPRKRSTDRPVMTRVSVRANDRRRRVT